MPRKVPQPSDRELLKSTLRRAARWEQIAVRNTEWYQAQLEAEREHLRRARDELLEIVDRVAHERSQVKRHELAEKARTAAAALVKAKRDTGRRRQAEDYRAEWLRTFANSVWSDLAPRYGKPGWRTYARELCAKHGIGCSDRTLDSRLREAREKGIVPALRAH